MNIFFISLLSFLCFSAWARPADSEVFHRALAAHHSPIFYQGIGRNAVADIFTSLDFDGDLNSGNNWKNTKQAAKAGSFVYYDIIETQTHWFITYNLFYPRDYAFICFWSNCHENDLEGIRLIVEKSPELEMGTVTMIEFQAHGDITLDLNPTFDDGHVLAFVQAGGHGIYSWKDRKTSKKIKIYEYSGDALDGGYDLLPFAEIWEIRSHVGVGKMWLGTFNYEGKNFSLPNLPISFSGTTWGNGGGNPPWNWTTRGLKKGDWFFDPAFALGLESSYVYNPYMGIESRESL